MKVVQDTNEPISRAPRSPTAAFSAVKYSHNELLLCLERGGWALKYSPTRHRTHFIDTIRTLSLIDNKYLSV